MSREERKPEAGFERLYGVQEGMFFGNWLQLGRWDTSDYAERMYYTFVFLVISKNC